MTIEKTYNYIFGPVLSRRLGRSLGIDLLPSKTCTLDCVFCQVGRTTARTLERLEYVPTEKVIEELKDWFLRGIGVDCLTLAGSGEPTLHSRFGEVLEFMSRNSSVPRALLSNGSLFVLPEVRAAARKATIVKVSLSAWDQASFERVNRPCRELRLDRIVESYKKFRSEFDGEMWMEVFLLKGVNSEPDDVKKIAALAADIMPDRVQLNTVVRPPAEKSSTAVPVHEMKELAGLFDCSTEVVVESDLSNDAKCVCNEKQIAGLLKRHPCTIEQIAGTFNINITDASECVENLLNTGAIRREEKNGKIYYM